MALLLLYHIQYIVNPLSFYTKKKLKLKNKSALKKILLFSVTIFPFPTVKKKKKKRSIVSCVPVDIAKKDDKTNTPYTGLVFD